MTSTETETTFTLTEGLDIAAQATAIRLEEIWSVVQDGGDPEHEQAIATAVLANLDVAISEWVHDMTKPEAHALADRLGLHHTTRTKVHDIAKGVVALAHRSYPGLTEPVKRIENRAMNLRLREGYIEETGRLLRYWASSDANDFQVQRRHGDVESVEAVLKHYGKIYCWLRGDTVPDLFEKDTADTPHDVETSLRLLGNQAIADLIGGEWASESMAVQVRIGALMGNVYRDIALKHLVSITHGSLDYANYEEDRPRVHYSHRSDYSPSVWTSPLRESFNELQP